MPPDEIKQFYERFSETLLHDYIEGSPRVTRQYRFLKLAIPKGARTVMVVGCGSGHVCRHIAAHLARDADVLGVDLSSRNINIANALFRHSRVNYLQVDITEGSIDKKWEVIVLPDVYEHIPLDKRAAMHRQLANALARNGRILMTGPTPAKQESLREAGEGLQVIDEDIRLQDLMILANDTGGTLIFYKMISVWKTHDYFHAIITRDTAAMAPIQLDDPMGLTSLQRRPWLRRSLVLLAWVTGYRALRRWYRKNRVRRLTNRFGGSVPEAGNS